MTPKVVRRGELRVTCRLLLVFHGEAPTVGVVRGSSVG
jgi:hypothetical protein